MKRIERILGKRGNHTVIYDLWKVADDVINKTNSSKPFRQRYTFNGKQYVLANAIKPILSSTYTNEYGLQLVIDKEFKDVKPSRRIFVTDYEYSNGKGTVGLILGENAAKFLWGDTTVQ